MAVHRYYPVYKFFIIPAAPYIRYILKAEGRWMTDQCLLPKYQETGRKTGACLPWSLIKLVSEIPHKERVET